MDNAKLVRAANQIAAFYAPYPREEALAGIAEHVQKFWEPRMRRRFADLIAAGGEGIDQMVRDSWPRVRV